MYMYVYICIYMYVYMLFKEKTNNILIKIYILVRAGSWIYANSEYQVFRKNLQILVELFKIFNVVRTLFFFKY